MNTDRPTTPNEACDHKTVTHTHGVACYTICSCRCNDCRAAIARYNRRRKTRIQAPRRGEPWEPRSPEWLAVMRRGLLTAVVESFERHGESRFL